MLLQGDEPRPAINSRFPLRPGHLVTLRQSIHLRLRLFDAHAGLEPSHSRSIVTILPDELRYWVERQGHSYIEAVKEAEVRRQNANHSVVGVIERDATADDVLLAAKPTLPQSVAKYGDTRAARRVFRGGKVTPRRDRLHAERWQEACRDLATLDPFRLARAGQRPRSAIVSGYACQCLALLLPSEEVRSPGLLARIRPLRNFFHPDEPFRVGIGQRSQYQSIDDAEDRRVRPDPERQRERRDKSEAWIFQQHSQTETQVLKHVFLQSLTL